jgi:hypothetical protein
LRAAEIVRPEDGDPKDRRRDDVSQTVPKHGSPHFPPVSPASRARNHCQFGMTARGAGLPPPAFQASCQRDTRFVREGPERDGLSRAFPINADEVHRPSAALSRPESIPSTRCGGFDTAAAGPQSRTRGRLPLRRGAC